MQVSVLNNQLNQNYCKFKKKKKEIQERKSVCWGEKLQMWKDGYSLIWLRHNILLKV